MMLFAWLGFEFQHPDDWECVRFSKNRQRGECAFADRAGQRLSLLWSQCSADVPPAQLLSLSAKAAEELSRGDKAGHVTKADWSGPGNWHGFQWIGAEDLTLAFAYFAQPGCVLQAQFHEGRKADNATLRRVLESFHFQSPDAPWRWSAFGCRLTLPREFELSGCEVVFGRTALTFNSPGQRGERVRFERLAMPEAQLKGKSLIDWRLGANGDGRRVLRSAQRQWRGHAAAEFELTPGRRTPAQWLMRQRRQSRGLAWLCEHEGRLYSAEWEGAAGGAPDFSSMLECCS